MQVLSPHGQVAAKQEIKLVYLIVQARQWLSWKFSIFSMLGLYLGLYSLFYKAIFLYVFPCVILFLCFSVLLVLRLPRLGKRELILVHFVRLFGLCLFRFVGFLFLMGSGKGCGLWLWHSLDFSLTFFLYSIFSGVCNGTICIVMSISLIFFHRIHCLLFGQWFLEPHLQVEGSS